MSDIEKAHFISYVVMAGDWRKGNVMSDTQTNGVAITKEQLTGSYTPI